MIRALLTAFALAGTVASASDQATLEQLFSATRESGGIVTVPPGDYHLSGENPIALASRTTVSAYGARFHFPETLPAEARLVLFAGTDLHDFAWHGGEFIGQVFDPSRQENSWEPSTNTRAIEITTTKPGGTCDVLFRDVKADGVAGAVIGVHGLSKKGSESEVVAYAERVTLENCTLLRSGKFMWDYGHLWQILTWPEEYEAWEVERARRHFRMDLVKSVLSIAAGDDRIRLDNTLKPIVVSPDAEPKHALSFLGEGLPENLVRGKQYFVVEAAPDFIRVAETPGGEAIRFSSAGGEGLSLVHNLQAAFWALYAPVGSSPGKGAFDITGAKDVRVSNCMLSALGDTMHIQRCRDIVFSNNHIIGSRMGAFFLAEFCQNATITGNLVDGTNGSRVISVEKSCEDVTITGNTFRNGGRGSWINQPKNFILANNVFVNNTTKGENDLRRGRRSYETGEPRRFPELYFTLHEEGGSYGPVIVRDNVFQLGDSAPDKAVTFAPNGRDLQMSGNTFPGRTITIAVDPSFEAVAIHDNPGAELKRTPIDFNHGRR
ncbi:MAG: right-handed parallel beta-helix repeat-containing protein [Verrucomicrobiales bacterium]|nr:right-handed parallel beta-helix repeat-containing protein [Verrucomicrobiales bacterium]